MGLDNDHGYVGLDNDHVTWGLCLFPGDTWIGKVENAAAGEAGLVIVRQPPGGTRCPSRTTAGRNPLPEPYGMTPKLQGVGSIAYELVIFDCDGVLVDSEPIAIRIDAMLFAEMGWPLSEDEIARRYVGRTAEFMLADLAVHVGRQVPPEVEEKYNRLYRELLEAELRPVDGVVEALDQIDTTTCVASSGSHEKMRFTLGITGLYERFEGRIFSATEVAHGKPAPDLFLHAAARMGVDPSACAVVEDSQYGVEAARAAGMAAFGYTGGVTPAERLDGPGTVLFSDMRQLPKLLSSS